MIATKNRQPESHVMKIRSVVASAAIVGCLLASGGTAAQAWVAIGTSTAYPVEGGTW
ncbi:hypothetical protein JT358_12105 [Micrococcales bacterium 31B]|nr:hypothetical protein [Micrococcales bacterium 31B]